MLKAVYLASLIFSVIVHAQQPEWGQCGGIGWTGATTCVSGSICTVVNPYYFQCLPGTSATISTGCIQATVTSTSISATQTLAYGQCGGVAWVGPALCEPGFTCTYVNELLSQCIPLSSPVTQSPNPSTSQWASANVSQSLTVSQSTNPTGVGASFTSAISSSTNSSPTDGTTSSEQSSSSTISVSMMTASSSPTSVVKSSTSPLFSESTSLSISPSINITTTDISATPLSSTAPSLSLVSSTSGRIETTITSTSTTLASASHSASSSMTSSIIMTPPWVTDSSSTTFIVLSLPTSIFQTIGVISSANSSSTSISSSSQAASSSINLSRTSILSSTILTSTASGSSTPLTAVSASTNEASVTPAASSSTTGNINTSIGSTAGVNTSTETGPTLFPTNTKTTTNAVSLTTVTSVSPTKIATSIISNSGAFSSSMSSSLSTIGEITSTSTLASTESQSSATLSQTDNGIDTSFWSTQIASSPSSTGSPSPTFSQTSDISLISNSTSELPTSTSSSSSKFTSVTSITSAILIDLPSHSAGNSSTSTQLTSGISVHRTTSIEASQATGTCHTGKPRSVGNLEFIGINIAGFDFGCNDSGFCSASNARPPFSRYGSVEASDEIQHFRNDDGYNTFRLPVSWQFLTDGAKSGTLNTRNFAQYDDLVQVCLDSGAYCIIDLHNYARFNGGIIGQGGPSNQLFASLWSSIALKYAGESRVMFGIMNAPHDISLNVWAATIEVAVNAIRRAGATSQIILLPGSNWSSAETFVSDGSADALNNITNPDGTKTNLIFDVHMYLDSQGNGKSTDCVTDNVDRAWGPLVKWLRCNGRKALNSATGGANTAACARYMCQQVAFQRANSDVILGYISWAAGNPDSSHPFNYKPNRSRTGWADPSLIEACLIAR